MGNLEKTKFEKLTFVVDSLVNDFSEDERKAIFEMDFSQLAGLHGEQLRSRISKSFIGIGGIGGGGAGVSRS